MTPLVTPEFLRGAPKTPDAPGKASRPQRAGEDPPAGPARSSAKARAAEPPRASGAKRGGADEPRPERSFELAMTAPGDAAPVLGAGENPIRAAAPPIATLEPAAQSAVAQGEPVRHALAAGAASLRNVELAGPSAQPARQEAQPSAPAAPDARSPASVAPNPHSAVVRKAPAAIDVSGQAPSPAADRVAETVRPAPSEGAGRTAAAAASSPTPPPPQASHVVAASRDARPARAWGAAEPATRAAGSGPADLARRANPSTRFAETPGSTLARAEAARDVAPSADDAPPPRVSAEPQGAAAAPARPTASTLVEAGAEVVVETTPHGLAAEEGGEAPRLRPTAQGAQSAVSAATAPRPPAIAANVATQIVAAIGPGAEGRVEIRLDPPELGRVVVTLGGSEAGLAATVVAERPETADLMRRHADILQRELRAAGHSEVTLSFGSAGSEGRRPTPFDRVPPPAEALTAAAPAEAMAQPLARLPGGGLDIRL